MNEHESCATKTDGRGDWNRTSDLLAPNEARYQAAPRPDRSDLREGGIYTGLVLGGVAGCPDSPSRPAFSAGRAGIGRGIPGLRRRFDAVRDFPCTRVGWRG